MTLSLIITRPQEDAEPLANELAALGVKSLLAPLLSIEVSGTKTPDLTNVQALLLTSANGVRAFTNLSKERKIPLYAVGHASALAAQKAGFNNVESAGGDVKTLAELVCEKLDFRDGAVLHIAGSMLAGDLAGILVQNGFDYRRIQLYHAKKVPDLPQQCLVAIKNTLVNGVVLYSPRTAKAFIDLLIKAEIDDSTLQLSAFCLSEAVAAKIVAYDWANIVVAKTPDQAALIKSVREFVTSDNFAKLAR
jgi:uroporphyrinogen-III synthase